MEKNFTQIAFLLFAPGSIYKFGIGAWTVHEWRDINAPPTKIIYVYNYIGIYKYAIFKKKTTYTHRSQVIMYKYEYHQIKI